MGVTDMTRLVLASESRYRRALLERLGLPFECAPHRYVESTPPGVDPADLVVRQAGGKAQSLVEAYPDALIIGSDQIAFLDGTILGKPGTRERAIAQLREMQGREHWLFTAVVVLEASSGRVRSHIEISPIRMRNLSGAEIERYVRRENPIDCAGSYQSEALGISLFEYQRGDDPTAVVGLPLIGLCRLLRDFGVEVP
jgi:septum formation protein